MLNISEGFCNSHKEFRHYLFVSRGSLGEIQSALYVALDQNYIDDDTFKEIYENCDEDSKIISGLIKSL